MRAAIRQMGNSSGVIIPKPLLAQIGVTTGDAFDLSLEHGRIVLVPVKKHVREGWAEDSKRLAACGDDALVWPEFCNAGDDDLEW